MTQDKQLESASKILDRYFESENPNNIPDGVYHQAKLAMEEYAAQFQLEHKQVGALWVKASERSPEKYGSCVIKQGELRFIAAFGRDEEDNDKRNDYFKMPSGRKIYRFLWEEENIYWLDEHQQQPISIEAIEKMAEKEADELVFNEHGDLFSNNNNEAANAFLVTKKGFIKGFTSALGYSAGDKLKEHLDKLFLECEHGDEQHRQWLKDKFTDYLKRQHEQLI